MSSRERGRQLGRRSRRARRPASRGFTLAELIVAGVITAFVLGAVTMALSRLGASKELTRERLEMHMKADAALSAIRKDICGVIRTDDLFETRLLITDDQVRSEMGDLERDELLMFVTEVRPTRDIQFSGEGQEYEVQYRVDEDEWGSALWRRRDTMPDEFLDAGGTATPLVDGVVAVKFEAYDGEDWYDEWDSDLDGLPIAVRATVTAAGLDEDGYWDGRPPAMLRTVAPIDRVYEPKDHAEAEEQLLLELEAEEAAEDAAEGGDGALPPGFDPDDFPNGLPPGFDPGGAGPGGGGGGGSGGGPSLGGSGGSGGSSGGGGSGVGGAGTRPGRPPAAGGGGGNTSPPTSGGGSPPT